MILYDKKISKKSLIIIDGTAAMVFTTKHTIRVERFN